MRLQGAISVSEISEFRVKAEELLKLVDTFKEDNTNAKKSYDNKFIDEKKHKRRKND